jgi:hypothetical protein
MYTSLCLGVLARGRGFCTQEIPLEKGSGATEVLGDPNMDALNAELLRGSVSGRLVKARGRQRRKVDAVIHLKPLSALDAN